MFDLSKYFQRKTSPLSKARRVKASTPRPRVRPRLEALEDRLAPAVSALFSAGTGTLTVSLSAANDQAFIADNAGAINVGTTDGGTDVINGQTGVLHLIVQDTGTNVLQAVTFNGTTAFAATVQTTGIETDSVDQALSGAVSGNASSVFVVTPGTIKNGIALAATAATVHVAAGTYNEDVLINKSLTLDGAQFGVDARTGRIGASESIILGTGSNGPVQIGLSVNNVTIDGFTIESPGAGSGQLNAGIWTNSSTGIAIKDNIVQNNTTGIAVGNSAADISFNLIQNNNRPGNGSGTGIEFFSGGSAAVNIHDNHFTGNDNGDVLIAGGATVSNVTINANDFVNSTGNPVEAFQATNLVVSNNHISGAAFSGVVLGGGDANVKITGNTFTNGQSRAILVADLGFSVGNNSDVTIANNTITQDVNLLTQGRSMIELNGVAGTSSVTNNVITLSGATNVTVPFVNGIDLLGALTATVTVSQNLIHGGNVDSFDGTDDSAGILLEASLPALAVIRINHNTITGFVDGIAINGGSGLVINQNNLLGNSNAALDNFTTAAVNAESNFWGSPSGPRIASNPSGAGDAILEANTGTVDYRPFLNHVALPFDDLFDQADGSQLSRAWVDNQGFFTVQGGKLVAGAAGTDTATLINLSVQDVVVDADVQGFGGTISAGLVARYTNPSNMYLGRLFTVGTQVHAQIWKDVNGMWQRLADAPIAAASGRLEFRVIGTSLTLLLNGALVAHTFDTSLSAAGSVGVRGVQNSTFDNFFVKQFTPLLATLPFDDHFNQANGSILSDFWTLQQGNFTVQNNQLMAATGRSIATLNGLSILNAAVQAQINVSNDGSVGLMARYSAGANGDMYWGGIIKKGNVFMAEIAVRTGGVYRALVDQPVAAGTGTLRFEVFGSSLKLFLNGQMVAFFSDTTLKTAGTVGIWANNGNLLDDFHAEAL